MKQTMERQTDFAYTLPFQCLDEVPDDVMQDLDVTEGGTCILCRHGPEQKHF